MAEKQPPKKKRLVKNPETFRERAIKAGQESDKPKRSAKFRTAGRRVLRPVTRPVAAAAGKAVRVRPVRALRKPASILGKILVPTYFRESWRELKLVKWPSRRESRDLTFAVLLFAVAFGIAIAIVDFGLDKLFRNVLLK